VKLDAGAPVRLAIACSKSARCAAMSSAEARAVSSCVCARDTSRSDAAGVAAQREREGALVGVDRIV
jgi:hypothetical protein